MPFDIGDLLKPVAEVSTSIGQIYLYRWNTADLRTFRNLSKETPDVRIRTFLKHISSLNAYWREQQPLKDQDFNLLTKAEIENLLENYLTHNPILTLKSHQINHNSLRLTREENESAISFLDRNLDLEIHQENQGWIRTRATWLKLSTEIRLEGFRTYTEELENKFQEDKESLLTKQNSSLSELTHEERERVKSNLSDDYYTIEERYIGQYRKSTIVSIYSFLEHSMNHLCELCQEFNALSLKHEELSGAGIERARLYLQKVVKINFELLNTEWSELKAMNKVRNRIVHADGALDDGLRRIINRTKGLSIKYHNNLIVDRTYIDCSITTVENFLKKLYSEAIYG